MVKIRFDQRPHGLPARVPSSVSKTRANASPTITRNLTPSLSNNSPEISRTIALALSIPLGVLLICLVCFAFYWQWRTKRELAGRLDEAARVDGIAMENELRALGVVGSTRILAKEYGVGRDSVMKEEAQPRTRIAVGEHGAKPWMKERWKSGFTSLGEIDEVTTEVAVTVREKDLPEKPTTVSNIDETGALSKNPTHGRSLSRITEEKQAAAVSSSDNGTSHSSLMAEGVPSSSRSPTPSGDDNLKRRSLALMKEGECSTFVPESANVYDVLSLTEQEKYCSASHRQPPCVASLALNDQHQTNLPS